MYYPVDSLGPEGFRNLPTGEQAANHVHNCAIFSLCHAILLGSVGCSKLTMDAIGCTKLKEFI
jgi:hypothetical protein